jgi:hypothetical protein
MRDPVDTEGILLGDEVADAVLAELERDEMMRTSDRSK